MTAVAATNTLDLSSCALEPIKTPGFIQPHGCLFACRIGEFEILHVSASAPGMVGMAEQQLIGADIRSVLCAAHVESLEKALSHVTPGAGVAARAFGLKFPSSDRIWDGSVHDCAGMRIYEFEPSTETSAATPLDLVRSILNQLQQARTLRDLCDQTVHLIRDLIGFDRVMVYRFLEDGAGQVVAEAKSSELEPLLNLRYPATDIPPQARELYKRNSIRLIADVAAEPSQILGAQGCGALDLTFAALRAVSPIHIEYLRNMKVGASMSISIIVGGELWGLIACHHVSKKHVPSHVRAAAELLGQVFSLQIQTVEGIEAYVTMRAARALLDRIVAEFPIDGDLMENLAHRLESLSAFISSDGVGLWMDGLFRSFGTTPSMIEMPALAAFVSGEVRSEVYATQRLGDVFPVSKSWPSGICGLLAVPLSQSTQDFLFFFRKEVAQTVDWGGNPDKPVISNGESQRLSPRKSFELWRQDVRGQSLPWTSRERLIGDTLRVYLLDIIVRFSEVILDERRKSQQRTRFITSELNNRVKGTLELIQSLVARGHEEKSVSSFVRSLEGRIGAISLAHTAVASGDGPQMRQLAEAAISAVAPLAEQVELSGPDIELDAKAYTVMALVMHELASNAVRYGALAVPQGHVSVSWHRDNAGRMVLLWQEAGGPPVRGLSREGLGLNIIRRNIPHSLGGEAAVDFQRSGLVAEFVIPARYLISSTALTATGGYSAIAGPAHQALEGFSILVLEDQMLTALDLEDGLKRMGAGSVEICGTVEKAMEAVGERVPDVAVLDVDLDDETSFPVADLLNDLEIPFLFMANEAERRQIPKRFEDVPVSAKPCNAERLAEQLRDVLMPNLIRAVLNKLV